MTKKDYQFEYASGRPQMYDESSRIKKAERMVKTLEVHFGRAKCKKLSVLDVGASTGIIDNELAKAFRKVTGTDIDDGAIKFAKKRFKRKNLVFQVDDAMALSFRNNTFDVVVCTHVYEHVSDSEKLMKEIYRVLKKGGVVYFAAINSLWPLEPHYDLLFLSWLPKSIAHYYVRLFGKAKEYYESPLNYWQLYKLVRKFKVKEYTQEILKKPQDFGYEDKINGILKYPAYVISPLAKYFAPTFFWILTK